MRKFGYAMATVISLGIIYIGARYLLEPGAIAPTFGVPRVPPGDDPFLRVKGVRDIASGLVVLALLATRQPRLVAIGVLVESVIPVGDALIVLGSGGSPAVAFGVHGATAAAMVAASAALLWDARRREARGSQPGQRESELTTLEQTSA
ncbi:MAG TPA: DUF4267 domain-containing protein [Pseudonocardia sp.]|jgi:hypothetical protein|uniref:DUF4267 domain-containing protein n=1 Tax=Pseudonocardia sp. TaxID=60912 RepID=UPI002CCAD563|nr:DUF4267 domain-containing protein [Pseudonocardia sp.]HTF55508.1 DUF4267 domain-containing protein [Pseudonocardia sp.]